jgi:hypothetical protein
MIVRVRRKLLSAAFEVALGFKNTALAEADSEATTTKSKSEAADKSVRSIPSSVIFFSAYVNSG